MRIAIDLDGTTANWLGLVLAMHNQEFHTQLTEMDITMWDFMPLLRFPSWEVFWRWAQRRAIFWHCRPYPGAVNTLKRLVRDGHEITFLTHRPDWSKQDTLDWLDCYGLPLRLVMTNGLPKSRYNFDLFVDDSPSVLADLQAQGMTAIRMVRKWNRPIADMAAADTWGGVERIIRALVEQ
jgi:uncharacterized HAD superfamily protein